MIDWIWTLAAFVLGFVLGCAYVILPAKRRLKQIPMSIFFGPEYKSIYDQSSPEARAQINEVIADFTVAGQELTPEQQEQVGRIVARIISADLAKRGGPNG